MRFPRATLVDHGTLRNPRPLFDDLMRDGFTGYVYLYSQRYPVDLYIVFSHGRPEIAIAVDGDREYYGPGALELLPEDEYGFQVFSYPRADLIISLFPEARITRYDLDIISPTREYRPYRADYRQYAEPPIRRYEPRPQPEMRRYGEGGYATGRYATAGRDMYEREAELRQKIGQKALSEAEIRRMEEEIKRRILSDIQRELSARYEAPAEERTPRRYEPQQPVGERREPPQARREYTRPAERPYPPVRKVERHEPTRQLTQEAKTPPAPAPERVEERKITDELSELERKIEERRAMLASMRQTIPSPEHEEREETRTGERIHLQSDEIVRRDEELQRKAMDIKKRIEEELRRKREEIALSLQGGTEPTPERRGEREETSARPSRTAGRGGSTNLFDQLIEMNKELRKKEE